MSRQIATFSANASQAVPFRCNSHKPGDGYLATCFIYGTFGSGSMAVQLSPDNGITWIPATDSTGTAITATANKMFNLTLGFGSNNGDSLLLRGVLTGATSPALNFVIFDNKA